MKSNFLAIVILFPFLLFAQTVVTTTPQYPGQTDKITLTFDVKNATHSNKIAGYTGEVYAHTGVTLQTGGGTPQKWQKVIGSWGNNTVQPKLSKTSADVYQLTIDNPRSFYGVSDATQKITELSFVLRSADGTKQTEDIFVQLFESGITFVFKSPIVNNIFGDPLRSPVFLQPGKELEISVSTVAIGKKTNWLYLYIDGTLKHQIASSTLEYKLNADQYKSGRHDVKIISQDEWAGKDSTQFALFKNPQIKNLAPPTGSQIGININNGVPLFVLYAPKKEFVYVLSHLNDWKVDTTFFMNRYEPKPDSVLWWIKMPAILSDPGYYYGYQFLIDGNLRIADPYAQMILDPSLDKSTYPTGKTENLVGVVYDWPEYTHHWKIQKFQRPEKDKLVIYELLVRDFVSTHSYRTLKDTLSYFKKIGINAIELMPVNEFEGNSSWGYNPSFYFAQDKYYGTRDELKAFIDACHENGIAVLMDIVLNHAYGSNSMVKMYFNKATGKPSADNPWFNQQSNFTNPDAQWGYDFNHESKATQYFVDRVLHYWLTEYKFDGFRFDFTKGIGNNIKTSSDPWGSIYDADRIRLLKRMVNKVWSYDPTAIMIFEHLADNNEETELANAGILLWGNMNSKYNEATMGYHESNKSNFEGISYKSRSWSQPNLVGYMESHDEERLMYKNYQYGNSSGSYNIKDPEIALQRMKLAGAFFFTVPGPKMIWQFGEIGYDISINAGGRLAEKPLRWDYYSEPSRNRLFKVWATLINLKKNYPAFSSTDFKMSVSSYLKRMWINHSSMNVVIIGNFGTFADSMLPEFQNTGKWYNYFTGEELNVTNVDMPISLEAGEFRIYTTVKLPTPEQGILSEIDANKESIPVKYELSQNYPNPFNPETVISYQLSAFSHVTLKVYDVIGREVATLVNELQPAGFYNFQLSTNNYRLTSGIYFYKLTAGNFTAVKKMMLIK